jgi:membrane-associated phospholipid phosphatase
MKNFIRKLLGTCLTISVMARVGSASTEVQQTQRDKTAQKQNQEAAKGDDSGSTLTVEPGSPTIKNKDIAYDRKITPWKRLPRYIFQDQKGIWTSPFHTKKADAKWWSIFGVTTAGLIATDRWTSKQLPNTHSQVTVATWTSRLGAAYSLLPISGAFYFIGLGADNDRFRETGILAFEAIANAEIVSTILKMATHRQRPLDGNKNGAFWGAKGSYLNASFPSGHAMNSWALASIVAHEYPRPLIIPITAYGLSTLVCGSRFAARKHFASDIIVGSAMGWFIGDYIYAKRHNRQLDKASAFDRVMTHVHLGGPAERPVMNHPDAERSAALKTVPVPASPLKNSGADPYRY